MSKRVLNVETTSQPFESLDSTWFLVLMVGFVLGGFVLVVFWVGKLGKAHEREHMDDSEALAGLIGDGLGQIREEVNNAVGPLVNAVAPLSGIIEQAQVVEAKRSGGVPTIGPRKEKELDT